MHKCIRCGLEKRETKFKASSRSNTGISKKCRKCLKHERELKVGRSQIYEDWQDIGLIYLIREREFITINKPIFKIGYTKNVDVRMPKFPRNSETLLSISVNHPYQREQDLLKLFGQQFTAKKEYGSEYFEGDPACMLKTAVNFLNPYLPNNIDEEFRRYYEEGM